MLKKLAMFVAASTMVLGSTAAQASSASALTPRNASAAAARADTPATKQSNLLPGSPLFAIIGILAVVALLEVTGVINILGDDEPESP